MDWFTLTIQLNKSLFALMVMYAMPRPHSADAVPKAGSGIISPIVNHWICYCLPFLIQRQFLINQSHIKHKLYVNPADEISI
jgi:hypothetical protein